MSLDNFCFSELGLYRTIIGAFGKMFSEAAFTTVFLYTVELYPTVMRSVPYTGYTLHIYKWYPAVA